MSENNNDTREDILCEHHNSFSNMIDNIEDLISDDSDGILGLVPYGFNSDSDTSDDLPTKSKNRRKRALVKKATWFAERNKQLREHGMKYYGRKKDGDAWNYEKPKGRRMMKARCQCKKRSETSTMKCSLVSEEEREQIFKEFWNMDWGQKKVYINILVTKVPIKRSRNRKVEDESRRGQTLQYHLKVRNKTMKVCRTLFLNTLCLDRHSVLNWLNKSTGLKKKPSKDTQHSTAPKESPFHKQREELDLFFKSLPNMESHYCHAKTQKKYLLPEWSSKKKLLCKRLVCKT